MEGSKKAEVTIYKDYQKEQSLSKNIRAINAQRRKTSGLQFI